MSINELHLFGNTKNKTVVDTEGQPQNKEVKDATFKIVCENIDGVPVSLYNYAQDYISYQERLADDYISLTDGEYLDEKIELFKLDYRADEKKLFRNDVSFLSENKTVIYLFEAQTKYSNEMAFRCMDYYCRLVNRRRKLMEHKYKETHNDSLKGFSFKLPRPEFYVFYFQNPQKKFTKLKDIFEDQETSEFLDCKVHNIQLSFEMFNKLKQTDKEIKAYCKFNKIYEDMRKQVISEISISNFDTKEDYSVYLAEEISSRTYEMIKYDIDIMNTEFIKQALLDGFLNTRLEEFKMMNLDEALKEHEEWVTKEHIINAYKNGTSLELIIKIFNKLEYEEIINILEDAKLM